MLKVLKFFYSIWTVVSFMLLTIPMAIGYLLLKLVPYKKQIQGVQGARYKSFKNYAEAKQAFDAGVDTNHNSGLPSGKGKPLILQFL